MRTPLVWWSGILGRIIPLLIPREETDQPLVVESCQVLTLYEGRERAICTGGAAPEGDMESTVHTNL